MTTYYVLRKQQGKDVFCVYQMKPHYDKVCIENATPHNGGRDYNVNQINTFVTQKKRKHHRIIFEQNKTLEDVIK